MLVLDHKITNGHKENDCFNELVQILNCLNDDQVHKSMWVTSYKILIDLTTLFYVNASIDFFTLIKKTGNCVFAECF